MKIDMLRLRAFGPFTGKVLDFSGDGHGLHVVFGANEAGKSTALRAVLGLLYGFGHKVEDGWLHDYKNLEVGGSLRLSGGGMLNLTRYKRRKNDLIDDDTGSPLDQLRMDAVLGGMDRGAFEHAFGISHQSLRQGVESVLAAGGELGHALFSATSGLNVLKKVMTGLEEEQDGLFRPRAQKSVINADIAELERLNKELRAVSASRHQWQKMKSRLDDLCTREARTADDLEAVSSKISLLSRYRDALRHVTRRDELQNELAALGPVPDLAEDFAERRVEIQVKVKGGEQAEENLQQELADIERRIETLTYDDRVISHAKIIEDLARQVSVHTTALADMKKLRGEIHRHKESARKNISLLRTGSTLEGIEAFRLSAADKSRIQRLGNRFAKLEEAAAHAERVMQAAKSDLTRARERLDGLETPRDISPLEDCLDRAGGLGKIQEQLSNARTEYASALEQAEADLSALGLWSGELYALERLAVPSVETMRGFETTFSEFDRGIEELKKEADRLEEELKQRRKALSDLAGARDLPSVEDLHSHRALRERGWRSVRSVWLERGEVDQGFVDAVSRGADLADAYEKAVSVADDTADTLRNQAEDVARAQSLNAGIQDLCDRAAAVEKRHKLLEKERSTIWDEWINLWEPLGIEPLNPRDMAAWSAKAGEIRRRAAECRRKKHAAARLKADMERTAAELTARLKELNVPVPERPEYADLLDLAKKTRRRNDRLIKERQGRESEIAGYERQIDDSTRLRQEAERDMKAWTLQWSRAVGRLGFSADAPPEDVNDFVLALDQVFGELEKAGDKQQRVAGMQSNYETYAAHVKELLDELAPDLAAVDPARAVVELHDRLASNQALFKDRRLFEEQRKQKHAQLSKVREGLAAEREKLRLLCEDAQTDAPDRLPEIESRAALKRRLGAELEAVNERLAELASGREIAAFVDEVQGRDPDELIARLARLDREKKDLQQEQKQLVRDIALQRKELEAIGGQSLAAGIAETARGLAGKIEADVEHYIRLRLAGQVLARAVERYRRKNQSPVLDAAGGHFKTITRGAFEGLRADYDEKGDPVIKAFRPDGRTLMVHEMSDGSRDQLFLALRLGGLEKYVKNNGPMPFIVDDVLVHFDDERSAAALAAMARLARDTQIIFFTHHLHLVHLARAALTDETLNVHSL
jgi:uncharacterized protein YhaN